MPIAAIYDIHGNLPALEAVLDEIRQEEIDQIVVGGDVIPGPLPQQTLDKLLELDLPVDFILGNGEVAVLQQMSGEQPAAVPEAFRPIIEWTAHQLDHKHQEAMQSWSKTVRFDSDPLGQLLFCHATPRNENEIFTRLTPEDRIKSIFAGIDATIVVCGHTHMQFHRTIRNVRIANAGSVGMPFGGRGAYWLLLGEEIEFRRTEYDFQKAAARIRASSYPQAEQFATNNILNPPSEKQMLEVFSKAEVK
jgi:putative phosphoesterase